MYFLLSFDTDTGLKQALATVNDYNPLMKDFPINELLSATELERIRSAVQVFLFLLYWPVYGPFMILVQLVLEQNLFNNFTIFLETYF